MPRGSESGAGTMRPRLGVFGGTRWFSWFGGSASEWELFRDIERLTKYWESVCSRSKQVGHDLLVAAGSNVNQIVAPSLSFPSAQTRPPCLWMID